MRLETIKVGRIVNAPGTRGEMRVQPRDADPYFLTQFKTFYIDGKPVTPYVTGKPSRDAATIGECGLKL